jgi:phospholipase A-2-activating protein
MGDVITEAGPSGVAAQSKYYPGDKYFEAGNYDYVFDVDDESGVPKVIPFNDGDNPMDAAERYCKREGLTKGYL